MPRVCVSAPGPASSVSTWARTTRPPSTPKTQCILALWRTSALRWLKLKTSGPQFSMVKYSTFAPSRGGDLDYAVEEGGRLALGLADRAEAVAGAGAVFFDQAHLGKALGHDQGVAEDGRAGAVYPGQGVERQIEDDVLGHIEEQAARPERGVERGQLIGVGCDMGEEVRAAPDRGSRGWPSPGR